MNINIKELRRVAVDCSWPTSPVPISDIIDRLEAAEKERDKLKELNIALCAKSNSQVIHNARLAEENDALRAKLEAMERQVPVATVRINAINGNPSVDFVPGHRYLHHNDKLYLAPGAKGEEK